MSENMSWLRCLYVAVCVVVLTGCHAASAGSRGQGGGGGGGGGSERSNKLAPRTYHRLPPRRHTDTEDLLIDEDDLMDAPKRAYSDYGHMRFGKRDDKFDEYGHMRFGRSEY